MSEVIIKAIKVKKVLSAHDHVDGGWFWSKYSAQQYSGCQYGCTYCFLRGSSYGIADDQDSFTKNITYKENLIQIFEEELRNTNPDIIVVGDYQPIEAKLGLSRKLLEICLKYKFPVVVVVKSLLILRDIDILKKLTSSSFVSVVVSIASDKSEGYREYFEPGATTIESRFELLRKLSEEGIHVGVSMMPIIPGVNDDPVTVENIIVEAKENGAKYVLGGGLTLLPGQKQFFYKSLVKWNPEKAEQLKHLYANSDSPKDDSWLKLGRLVKKLCIKHDLDYRMKRYVQDSPLKDNKLLAEKLFLEVYEKEIEGIDSDICWSWRKLAWKVDEAQELITNISLDMLIGQELKIEGAREFILRKLSDYN